MPVFFGVTSEWRRVLFSTVRHLMIILAVDQSLAVGSCIQVMLGRRARFVLHFLSAPA